MEQAPGPASIPRKAGYRLRRIPKNVGPFLASNVPAGSFLTVHAIWPKREPADHALQALITKDALLQEDADCARHLLDVSALGLGKLETLMDLICIQSRPITPTQTIGSLGDQLGPYAQLVSLHNLLDRRLPSLPHDGQGGLGFLIAADANDSAAATDLPLPAPCSLTETLVIDFLVTFIAAIATQIQPPTRIPVCVANVFEQTFQFGLVSGADKPAAFRARTDGGIPLGQHRSILPVIIFEGKSAKRDGNNNNKNSHRETDPFHHTLMIAQDADEVFISISSYTDAYISYLFKAYISYLFKPTPAAVLSLIADVTHMLEIQEFGPFKISTRSHLRLLAHIILALLVKELRGLKAGTIIRSVWEEIGGEHESD
ncbi:hypothetical protein B0T25DRAFT_587733 [Lasiosphaeria hispida]|uniref:Uncharacterized protein n=1 Tax=Lasiosphaeria hispida TaxID=260671 RepID=A0AAJ0HX14_9PEZI|nr:hypothetical protein B0T25DRAFT_587733 [Lasiosphaeria hispida]